MEPRSSLHIVLDSGRVGLRLRIMALEVLNSKKKAHEMLPEKWIAQQLFAANQDSSRKRVVPHCCCCAVKPSCRAFVRHLAEGAHSHIELMTMTVRFRCSASIHHALAFARPAQPRGKVYASVDPISASLSFQTLSSK